MTEKDLLLSVVKEEATKIDKTMRADIAGLQSQVDPLLIEVLEYGLLSGGKRVRPLLVVMSARLAGCQDEQVYELAKAFEYLHAATLFHDDVIDNAHTRRGRPAVNRQFGLVAAILAGDFLHARSMDLVGGMAGQDGLGVFCHATAGMVDGEFMQLRNASETNLSEEDYAEAIMGKTGLLIAASCEIGAIYGGATPEERMALRSYGVGLGSAFQMIDDLLDYTGDQEKTGKQLGNDLAEGKMTLPLIATLKSASPDDKGILEEILGSESLRQEQFTAVHELIVKYDGYGATRKKAERAVSDAVSQLEIFTDNNVAGEKRVLQGLAQYVLTRDK